MSSAIYSYINNIKTPDEMGISNKGNSDTLNSDISSLAQYVNLLISGNSTASKITAPFGNKYFLKTAQQCNDNSTNSLQDRYIYINNAQKGSPIPGLGSMYNQFNGLIPSAIKSVNSLNPFSISLMSNSTPTCQKISLETIDSNNKKSLESNYVSLVDIESMDACNFPDKINPITKKKCVESFSNIDFNSEFPHDFGSNFFLFSTGLLIIYIIFKVTKK
jgi:hypothetical protein